MIGGEELSWGGGGVAGIGSPGALLKQRDSRIRIERLIVRSDVVGCNAFSSAYTRDSENSAAAAVVEY